MRVFVTGASGHVAAALVPELLEAGYEVVGLARSSESTDVVRGRGAEVLEGDMADPGALSTGARDCDGVIHLAFSNDFSDYDGAVAADLAAVQHLGEALEGSGRPLVVTSGTLLLCFAGLERPGTEQDVVPTGPRVDAENAAVALAERGVRSSVVRLPPSVHSPLDAHGFAHQLVAVARERGAAGYVGDGAQRWPAVNTVDAAHLYRLALESAPAGTRLHAVADEGVTMRQVAAVIGERLGVPTESIDPGTAMERYGFLGGVIQLDNPTSAAITRDLLGWTPQHPGLLDDLATDHYTPPG